MGHLLKTLMVTLFWGEGDDKCFRNKLLVSILPHTITCILPCLYLKQNCFEVLLTWNLPSLWDEGREMAKDPAGRDLTRWQSESLNHPSNCHLCGWNSTTWNSFSEFYYQQKLTAFGSVSPYFWLFLFSLPVPEASCVPH